MNHSNTGARIITATGRVPGRKGTETRQRLLDEIERRCLVVHHSSISVGEITRAAQTSAATFYHYFPDVAAAAAEVANKHLSQFDDVLKLAREIVASDGEFAACEAFTKAFFEYWQDRPGLIEAIVVASRDEDPRFFRVLMRALVSLTTTLAVAVKEGHVNGVAGSLVMMMSLAAARRDGFSRDGVSYETLVDSQARILHATLSAHTVERTPTSARRGARR